MKWREFSSLQAEKNNQDSIKRNQQSARSVVMSLSQKVDLKVAWCSYKAAKYAVLHWHYSKRMPTSKMVHIGVWENDDFVGAILFGLGVHHRLVTPYGLEPTEGCELLRIALTDHGCSVSQMISIALALLQKNSPGLRLIVSYSDPYEKHHGGIYQAGNWIYTGTSAGCYFFQDKNGRVWHPRNVGEDLSLNAIQVKRSECQRVWRPGKHRYLYPLDKPMRRQINKLRQPYPKRTPTGGASEPTEAGGSMPTRPLQIAGQAVKVT